MQEYALTEQIMFAGIPPPEGSDNAELLTMSTLNEEGVMNVKQVACDRLLSSRVETKLQVHARSALYVAPPAPPPVAVNTLCTTLGCCWQATCLRNTLPCYVTICPGAIMIQVLRKFAQH